MVSKKIGFCLPGVDSTVDFFPLVSFLGHIGNILCTRIMDPLRCPSGDLVLSTDLSLSTFGSNACCIWGSLAQSQAGHQP